MTDVVMLAWVAAGSALGGVARFLLGGLFHRLTGDGFPLGTLVINITGSFLLGFIYRYTGELPAVSPEVRTFLTIGLCGGYTTFSTFSYDSVRLLETGQTGKALAYVGLSVVISLGALMLGMTAGRELLALRRG